MQVSEGSFQKDQFGMTTGPTSEQIMAVVQGADSLTRCTSWDRLTHPHRLTKVRRAEPTRHMEDMGGDREVLASLKELGWERHKIPVHFSRKRPRRR